MELYTADMLNVLYAYGVYLLVFVANVLFSLYLNIEVLHGVFDKSRIGLSIKKALVLVLGTLMLVLAVDAIMAYFSAYVPELADEVRKTVTVVAIVATIGRAAIKYLVEAYQTFQAILLVSDKKE
ncbi:MULTISPECIES: hypothetical protein [Erysipelotrichaceae]|uniref:Uncharacterized protein n=1 Tax=[Eubacterium] hominis TaxID=2764325 RepID=A0A7G9GNL0_9FIRM|nr:hypothetical protein [Absiella sp. AM27-20]QNM12392.1 hypothetical protein H9Q80_00100 [[Eubacterium] hominis]RHU10637.1 hypothetical protein DW716_01060 [Absiella sp. AM27-20]